MLKRARKKRCFVILSEAKNLSTIQVQKKERFLGEERASE
jgi:hypothetical protein